MIVNQQRNHHQRKVGLIKMEAPRVVVQIKKETRRRKRHRVKEVNPPQPKRKRRKGVETKNYGDYTEPLTFP